MAEIRKKPINELEKKTWVSNQDSILIVDSVTGEARLADKEELRWVGISNVTKSKSWKTTTITIHTTDGGSYQVQLEDGGDGYTPEFKLEGTVFKWKFPNESQWTTLFDITSFKGEKGNDGVWISEITHTKSGKTTTITIKKTDGSSHPFNIEDGEKGNDGKNPEFQLWTTHLQWRLQGESEWKDLIPKEQIRGATITNIAKTAGDSSPWTTDTYTISLSDGQAFNFFVYHGRDGSWSGDMLKANNLSDIPDKEQARANLELYSIAQITALLQNMLTSTNLNSVARTLSGLIITPWNWSGSASLYLKHPNGKMYEFFSDGNGAFGVWDKTSDQNVLRITSSETIFYKQINANDLRITKVANPVDWKDAVNKQYLESQKNQTNGIAGLDNNKKLDPSVIPVIATTETVVVANKTARLALTTAQVQRGDYAIQTDSGEKFILSGNNPQQEGHRTLVADTTPDWSQIDNKPSAFTPATHTHTKEQVGLGKVDNTSDAEKNSAVATLTNKTINGDNNTITKVNSLKNQNGNTEIKTRAGTKAQHTAVGTKDANTLYFVTEN